MGSLTLAKVAMFTATEIGKCYKSELLLWERRMIVKVSPTHH